MIIYAATCAILDFLCWQSNKTKFSWGFQPFWAWTCSANSKTSTPQSFDNSCVQVETEALDWLTEAFERSIPRTPDLCYSCLSREVCVLLCVSALRYMRCWFYKVLKSEYQALMAKPCLILEDWRHKTALIAVAVNAAYNCEGRALLGCSGVACVWERETERKGERTVKLIKAHDKSLKGYIHQTIICTNISHTHNHTVHRSWFWRQPQPGCFH